jgi:type II secretory pathway predicted ATPase ExeA
MSTGDPNDPRSRHLVDDPGFLASLSELDDGLGPESSPRKNKRAPTTKTAAPAASPATVALPPVVTAPGGRPLLDLFSVPGAPRAVAPPIDAPVARRVAAGPVIAPPPVRRPFSLERTPSSPASTYELFYGLNERPFSLSSDPKFLYQSAEYERVAQHMLAAIGRREGLVVLTGEVGVGKTTLCRAIVEQLDRRTLTSVVTEPFRSLDELLKQLLVDFGVVSKADLAQGRIASATQGELAGALREFLQSLTLLQAFAVVIIDEAQRLPSDVLHELRHLVSGDERLMQLVLVGQPDLTKTINTPAGNPLALSVSMRHTLGPLADDEVGGYVMHRLRVAGSSPRVEFEDVAFERVYVISGGKPRLVNLLCDRALAIAFGHSASVVDRTAIDQAAVDLDMAPPFARGRLAGAPSAAILLLLMLAGAAVAALAFHSDVAALLARLR